ncbi:MAG: YbaN family protein [Steroidobacteraceae bacterium]|nr:YbaN family protein [Steroidobacteraceae bacterium]
MTQGPAAPHREHGSPVVRALFFVAGVTALALGIAGIFLPVLPTTPLVLLAATCFARSYRPFHEWLVAHRLFGPIVREWHEHRSIPYRTKLFAIGMMAVALGTSIVFFVDPPWLKASLAAFGVALGVYMYRLPSRN